MTDPTHPDIIAIDRAIAECVLGRITPEQIVDLAVRAVQQGCVAPSIATLGGLSPICRADIDDELPRALTAFNRHRPPRTKHSDPPSPAARRVRNSRDHT